MGCALHLAAPSVLLGAREPSRAVAGVPSRQAPEDRPETSQAPESRRSRPEAPELPELRVLPASRASAESGTAQYADRVPNAAELEKLARAAASRAASGARSFFSRVTQQIDRVADRYAENVLAADRAAS